MMLPQMLLDSYVRKLKDNFCFDGVKFVFAKRNTPAQKPVTEYFVSCGVTDVEKNKDEIGNSNTSTELEFCIYAPCTSGGRELSQFAAKLMDVLDVSDTENRIENIRIYDSEYDKDLASLYQKVRVRVVDVVSVQEPESAQTNVNIIVNKVPFAVLKAELKAKDEIYRLGELMSGDSGFMKKGVSYTATVTVYKESDPFAGKSFFDISFDNEESVIKEFKVVQINESILPDKKPVREYTFEAYTKEGCGEVYGV